MLNVLFYLFVIGLNFARPEMHIILHISVWFHTSSNAFLLHIDYDKFYFELQYFRKQKNIPYEAYLVFGHKIFQLPTL